MSSLRSAEADAPPGYRLVFHDAFEQPTLNPAHWTAVTDGRGGGNYESQYYTPSSLSILPSASSPSGHKGLALTAAPIIHSDLSNVHELSAYRSFDLGAPNPHQPYESQRYYLSGKVTSQQRFAFQYGRVDVRARLPAGSHTWPAIWLLPARQDGGRPETTWPNLGEIDVMELIGKDRARDGGATTITGALNYGSSPTDHHFVSEACRLPQGEEYSDAFHVFSVLWEPACISWFVDGRLYSTKTPADLVRPWPFGTASAAELLQDEGKQNPFFLIINLAIGGNLGGLDVPPLDQLERNGRDYCAIDVTAANYVQRPPQVMVVDYVRVYQLASGAPLQRPW